MADNNATAVATQAQQAQITEAQLEEKKNALLALLEKLLKLWEKFRRPKPWEVMKKISDAMEDITVANGATVAVLEDLVQITNDIEGRLNGNITPEQSEQIVADCQKSIEELRNDILNIEKSVNYSNIDEVARHAEEVGGELALYKDKDSDNLYLCIEKNGILARQFAIKDEFDGKSLKIIFDENFSMDELEKIPLPPLSKTNGETDKDAIEGIVFNQLLTKENYKDLSDKINELKSQEMSLMEKKEDAVQKLKFFMKYKEKQTSDDGRYVSFFGENHTFNICDTSTQKMMTFEASSNEVKLMFGNYDENYNIAEALDIGGWSFDKKTGLTQQAFLRDKGGVIDGILKTSVAQEYFRNGAGFDESLIEGLNGVLENRNTKVSSKEELDIKDVKAPTLKEYADKLNKELKEAGSSAFAKYEKKNNRIVIIDKKNNLNAVLGTSKDGSAYAYVVDTAKRNENGKFTSRWVNKANDVDKYISVREIADIVSDYKGFNLKEKEASSPVLNEVTPVLLTNQLLLSYVGKEDIGKVNCSVGDTTKTITVNNKDGSAKLNFVFDENDKPSRVEYVSEDGKRDVGRFIDSAFNYSSSATAQDKNNSFIENVTALVANSYVTAEKQLSKVEATNIKDSDKQAVTETYLSDTAQRYKDALTVAATNLTEAISKDGFDDVIKRTESELNELAVVDSHGNRSYLKPEHFTMESVVDIAKRSASGLDLNTDEGRLVFNNNVRSEIERSAATMDKKLQDNSNKQPVKETKENAKANKKEVDR